MEIKIRVYTRFCNQCLDYYKTEKYYSHKCEECKKKNQDIKVMKTLNLVA